LRCQMPEQDSDSESLRLGRLLVEQLQVDAVLEDIGPLLEIAGCYRRRDEAIRTQVPEYGPGHKCKIALSTERQRRASISFILWFLLWTGHRKTPAGRDNLSGDCCSDKQRARKFFEYYHANRLNFAVAGTPNSLSTIRDSLSGMGTVPRTSSQSHISINHRSTNWPNICRFGRNPATVANHRCLFNAPDSGGILLFPSIRTDGPMSLWPEPSNVTR